MKTIHTSQKSPLCVKNSLSLFSSYLSGIDIVTFINEVKVKVKVR